VPCASITYLHHVTFLIFSSYLYARCSSIQPSAAHITWHTSDTTHQSLHASTLFHTKHFYHHYRHLSSITIHITYHCARYSPFTHYPTMNAFPNGTRVFYWDANGTIKYGTVESTSRMTDGTLIVNVKVDGGSIVSLPVSSVSKVT
jgi:hypothetical protein